MAGLGWRKFNAGEVLTANNFQSYGVDQTVQVYAGTAARGSAIGTAVSEGMVSYLADSNVVQAYDGSAWNSLAYATEVSAIPRVGLVSLVAPTVNYSGGTATANSSGEISFTAVTSISLNNVFSSSYKDYRLILNVPTTSASSTSMGLKFRTGGTDNSNNSYYQYWTIKRISGVLQDNSGGPSTSYALTAKVNSNTYGNWTGDIMSPYSTSQVTTATGIGYGGDSTNSYNVFNTVLFDGTTSFDGFTITASSGTMTGSLSIYGYRT